MFGTLVVKEPESDGTVIVDGNGRVIAECKVHADAVDLAAAWNRKRTPQQEQDLEIMRSRGEL
jgi:hypothetical protein